VLGKGEFLNILRPVQKGDIDEGDEIGEANEVVDKVIGSDEEGYSLF